MATLLLLVDTIRNELLSSKWLLHSHSSAEVFSRELSSVLTYTIYRRCELSKDDSFIEALILLHQQHNSYSHKIAEKDVIYLILFICHGHCAVINTEM